MHLTRTPDVEVPAFRFVPAGFDPADAAALDGLVQKLLERPLEDADALRRWIYDRGEVGSMVWGEWARRLTAMNRATADKTLKQAYLDYNDSVMPAWQTAEDKLNRKYLASPHRAALGRDFEVFDREKAKAAEIFREENTELFAEDKRQAAAWQEIQGGLSFDFRGETLTREQCFVHLQSTDRATREEAFLTMARRMQQERDRIDGIFDELISIRHRMARNAGFENYLEFGFANKARFDYTPADCEGFHRAVETVVGPALEELREERRRRLGLETIRPYDTQVSLAGSEPARLFANEDEFIDLASRVFGAVDQGFADTFDILVRNGLLDLMSRPGKAPGGYNCPVEDMRLPFIFFNAVGQRNDLRVLLHEGGHAFHTIAARDLPVMDYRHAPSEFAEVASMAMELLGLEKLEGILDQKEVRELVLAQHEHGLVGFGQVALVDAFQHWVYRHPEHERAERDAKWVELQERFMPGVDWSGLEEFRGQAWQKIPHFFTHPLYYIEYGIAYLGALQLWQKARRDHAGAVAGYREGLALGGSRPLPELFGAAGVRFAMDEQVLREVVPGVMSELRGALAGS